MCRLCFLSAEQTSLQAPWGCSGVPPQGARTQSRNCCCAPGNSKVALDKRGLLTNKILVIKQTLEMRRMFCMLPTTEVRGISELAEHTSLKAILLSL